MSDLEEIAAAPRPRRDVWVGLFFLAWAGAGWISVATNPQLFSDLYGGLDPGPALLPIIVLGVLTAGGSILLLSGAVRALRLREPSSEQALGASRDHLLASAMLASLAVYPSLMDLVGFPWATAVFVAGWVLALTPSGSRFTRESLLLMIASMILITGGLYLGFVVFIHVPLP